MYAINNLNKLPKIGKLSPEAASMAIAVALTTQCPYCIEVHRQDAVKVGATGQELTEVIHGAVAPRAGAAVIHGTHLLER